MVPDNCATLSYRLKECLEVGGFIGRLQGKCKGLEDAFEHCKQVEFQRKREESLVKAKERVKRWKEANKDVGL